MSEQDQILKALKDFDYPGFHDLRQHANHLIAQFADDLHQTIAHHAKQLRGDVIVGGDGVDPVLISLVLESAWRQSLDFWLKEQTAEPTPPAPVAPTPPRWVPVQELVKQAA